MAQSNRPGPACTCRALREHIGLVGRRNQIRHGSRVCSKPRRIVTNRTNEIGGADALKRRPRRGERLRGSEWRPAGIESTRCERSGRARLASRTTGDALNASDGHDEPCASYCRPCGGGVACPWGCSFRLFLRDLRDTPPKNSECVLLLTCYRPQTRPGFTDVEFLILRYNDCTFKSASGVTTQTGSIPDAAPPCIADPGSRMRVVGFRHTPAPAFQSNRRVCLSEPCPVRTHVCRPGVCNSSLSLEESCTWSSSSAATFS